MPYVRVWPRVVGVGRAMNNPRQVIRFGLPGESDIDGIIMPNGRKLCIEVKTGNAKLSKNQETYRNVMVRFGALHIVARDVLQALEEFEKKR